MQYFRFRQLLMSPESNTYTYTLAAMAYICVAYVSVQILLASENSFQSILGIVGVIIGAYALHHTISNLLVERGHEASDSQPADLILNMKELLRARKGLMSTLVQHAPFGGSYACVLDDGTSTQLDIIRDEHSYSCCLKYYDTLADVFYTYDYTIQSNRKTPVYVKKSEVLFPVSSRAHAVLYETAEKELATHEDMLALYILLSRLPDDTHSL